jgi:NhaP-type Na+/H+ or K+/H+ antiporter
MHDLEALAPLWLLVALLGASVAVAILTRRWNLPFSVVLVVVGLLIALALPTLHVSPAELISPELLLAVVLPGLVFEAAFRTDSTLQDRDGKLIVNLGFISNCMIEYRTDLTFLVNF